MLVGTCNRLMCSLLHLCNRLILIQGMSIVCPGRRLTNEEDLRKIIEGSCTFMDGLYRTYSEPPVWKFIKTKGYRKLERGHNIINRQVNPFLYEFSWVICGLKVEKSIFNYLYT